jgi:glycosyltransferase involved in cell wall biosynthesis
MVISEGTAATDGGHIAVIIAARNAAGTIGAAVRSALSQPETSEVIVVDDGSTDNTGASALAAAAGDPRLRVLRPEANVGPAAARNIAIAASAAPVIALLDADDMFLPGRLGRLTAIPGWDLIADNIAFVPDTPDLALPAAGGDGHRAERARPRGIRARQPAPQEPAKGGAGVSQTPDPEGFH